MQQRILVIGGGLAGLAAAATAARAGAAVTMLEARDRAGGRGRTHAVEGFLLNEGAHALYAGGAGSQLLRALGIEPRGGRPPASPGYGLRDGALGLLPGTPLDALRSRLIGLRAKAELGRLLARPARLVQTVRPGTSMQEWIDAQVRHPDARAIVAMATRVACYADALAEIAAEAAVPQLVMALDDGVRYLDGGFQQIVDALAGVAERAGAKMLTGEKVPTVAAAHEHFGPFDATILAVGGPAHADTLLDGASAAVRSWAAELRPVLASTLDLGLRRLPVPAHRFVIGVDAPIYLSVHTPTAALAPDGGEVVHCLRYGDGGARDGDARGEMEALLDLAQPGWREEVVAHRFGRRMVVAHGRPEPASGLAGRPGPVVPDMDRTFVAGDWVGPVGLLADAALVSGAGAARLALGVEP